MRRAGVVDERLNRHLPAILEAGQIVRDERFSLPTAEQALRGTVPVGYGRPSTANPNFRETTRLRSAPRSSVWTPLPPGRPSRVACGLRHSPSSASPRRPWGRGPSAGGGPAQVPCEAQAATPLAPAGHCRGDGGPGSTPGGDGTPSVTDQTVASATTPGRDGLRSLLVHLNEVPQELMADEAHKLHLYLATRSDVTRHFPQRNLRSQCAALGKLLPTRPELDRLIGGFSQEHQLASTGPRDQAPESEGAARVMEAVKAIQAGGSSKPPGKGKGGADYDTYSVAVMVKWQINPRDPPEPMYPMSPGRLGMVLKKAFGDFRVSYIKDEGHLSHTEDGRWAIMGMRPEAAHVLEWNGGDSDKQFSYEWSKANRQLYAGGLLRSHQLEKSDAIAPRLWSGELMAGPQGVVRRCDRDGGGDEGRKRRRSPSVCPLRASCRSEDDCTPRRGRYSSPDEEPYRAGQRPTP